MILKGLTEEAYRNLLIEDIELFESFIGCEVYYDEDTGRELIILPDNDTCHRDFLILE